MRLRMTRICSRRVSFAMHGHLQQRLTSYRKLEAISNDATYQTFALQAAQPPIVKHFEQMLACHHESQEAITQRKRPASKQAEAM
jgi:putative heme iron utilization protein